MKKRLLMLLSLFMAITSVGWINAQSVTSQGGKLTKAILPKECKKTDLETKVSCFANGNPVRIYQGSDGFMVVEAKLDNGKVDTLKFLPGEFSVYGGSLGKKVDNSSITLENGKVYSLFGGGMYTNDSSNMPSGSGDANADVSGTASINVTGGSVTNLLVGGGRYYAKTNAVEINISTNESIANIYVGGYDQGGTTNTLATSLEASVNGVKTVKLTMNGGQVTEGIGCGGGQGYTYTGDSEIKLNGVTIGAFYGVLANGRADKIKATVTDCTFAALTKCYEFASVNRGTAGNIDFTFDGCSFNDLGKINACLGPINGWADSDTDGKVIPSVTGKAVFKFVNSKTATPVMQIGQGLETANIDLIGAKAAIKKFYKKTESSNPDDIISSFTLGAKKTWNFYNGLLTEDGTTLEQEGEGADKGILNNMYFANGKAITIEARNNNVAGAKIGTEEYDATLQVYGGSYKKDVAGSTNITMNGGAVKNIYGGGYGSNNKENDNLSADVQNVGIKINGGTVSNLVVGGGMYRAKANDVVITVSGEHTSLNHVICGGYDQGKTSNKLETSFEASVNRIANTTFTMTNGTIKGYLFVGGGQGYSYSKTAKATLNGTLLNYGVLGTGSNGRSDNVEVSLTGCTFAKADKQTGAIEIAALNRGIVNNASMTFKGCTFPTDTKDYYCYSGATFQYDGTSEVKLGDVTMSFDGCTNTPVVGISSGLETANVTLNGAKASVAAFEASSTSTVKTFTIAKDKTWNLNGGLEFATEEDKTATLTNNGTLNVPATSIMSAIEVGGALAVNAESADVVAEMNKVKDKSDLSSKTFSIECKDGVIASNETVAKDLLKEGKVVMVLSFDNSDYSITAYQKILAKITNLPDSVVYGTEPIKLAFNYKVAEAKISGTDNGIVKIENGVLTILKPGEVKLDITPDTNDDNKVDESDDADTKSTQTLKVTKRTLTLTAGIVPDYGNGSKGDSIVYDANKNVTLKWDAANIAVSGLPWESVGFISTCFDTTVAPTGTRANKNVGSKVPVKVGAITLKDSADYYTLAPITFVTAKVVKAPVTVTANNVDYIFGSDLPTFKATTTGLLGSPADVLDGTLKFICPATPDSLVKDGGYAIMPYGLTSDNYAIKYVAGKLTVKPTNPKIEIVDSKVIGTTGAKTITVQAKLVHAGGLETATVTAKDAESEVTSASENAITPDANGIYKFEVANAAAKKHTITFTATTTESSNNTGTASIDVTVEAGTPQNLKFDDKVLSSIVYGDSLPLIVLSDQSAAIGKYTFSAKEGEADAAIISANNVLKPSKAGDVVVTVSREADETYSSATITKTIKVNPRPLKASVAAFTPKTYDGSVTATVPAITLSADYKVIGTDKVNIKTDATPTATYASKNVGTHAITLSTLELDGAQKDNYTLIQPTGLTGEITKKDATVKVDDVTRMYNQRYTKYTFTPTGLVDGESLSSVYTGKLEVTENEKEGKLTLKIDGSLCQNYNLTPEDGELTVTKGTPVVVAYNKDNVAQALVVDSAGHQNLTVSKDLVDGYFLVTGDDKKVTKSVNAISLVQTTALLSTKAGDEWAGWNSEEATTIEYAATGQTTTNVSDYTYSSTDLNRLSINGTDLTASGVGKVAIIATNTTSGDVKVKLYDVKPKTVTYKAEMNKTYDGLTQATGTVTLEGVEGNDNVVLDLEGVTFNYTSPKAGTYEINPSQAPILMGTDANNYNLVSNVSGKIAEKEITVSTPISAYYTGKTDMTLNEFTSEGVLSNDIVSLNVSLDKAEVGPREFTLIELEGDNAGNYTLSKKGTLEGTILKPTIVVTVPETAPSAPEVKNRLTYTIRETGEVVSKDVFGKNVKVVSLGNNVYQVSTTEENPNYSLVYTKNLIGYKSEGSDTPGGDGDETVTISLDATTKTLPRNEEFVLKATVSNGKTVTWSSSDPTIASVTADGNKATVKGLKVGKATITAKIGDVTASCEVTVDFATGLEEALANTQVYAKQGNIYVNPVQPLQLTIVNMIGKVVYNARISSYAQIPVAKGIYIVKLTNAGNTVVTKVNVY